MNIDHKGSWFEIRRSQSISIHYMHPGFKCKECCCIPVVKMGALAALVAFGGRDQTRKLSAIREVQSSFLSGEKAVLMNASPRTATNQPCPRSSLV